jgi:hypothetical protein
VAKKERWGDPDRQHKPLRSAGEDYSSGLPRALPNAGGILRRTFTNAVPGQPDCAFTEENDGTQETIAELVRKGYLARTRTDADTKGSRET